jgi:hypothetical protein
MPRYCDPDGWDDLADEQAAREADLNAARWAEAEDRAAEAQMMEAAREAHFTGDAADLVRVDLPGAGQ